MTIDGTGNSVTHILTVIWCINSILLGYKVKYPKFGNFRRWSTLEIPHGRIVIDTIMGISRDHWKCPEDYICAFWGL